MSRWWKDPGKIVLQSGISGRHVGDAFHLRRRRQAIRGPRQRPSPVRSLDFLTPFIPIFLSAFLCSCFLRLACASGARPSGRPHCRQYNSGFVQEIGNVERFILGWLWDGCRGICVIPTIRP